MPVIQINLRRFGEYKNIFGNDKIRFLWNEYLAQSSKSWQDMNKCGSEQRRLYFHNWRSSSQVFGMDEFAHTCQVIEDHILNQRLTGLEEMIADSRGLYDQSVNEVVTIFLQMEQNHD